MKTWTLSHIEKLKESGKIRDFRITSKSKKGERSRHLKKVGKQKYWMELRLVEFCSQHNLTLVPEYQFHSKRKFRFDFCIKELMLAIEYEGIFSEKSRHTTFSGYSQDSIKYNLAVSEGYKVLRYTAMNYKNLIDDLKKNS